MLKIKNYLLTFISGFYLLTMPVYAQEQGTPIRIPALDNLIWSVIKTIQIYSLPLGAFAIAVLGVQLLMSDGDASALEKIKSYMWKVLLGTALIWGAASISSLVNNALSVGV